MTATRAEAGDRLRYRAVPSGGRPEAAARPRVHVTEMSVPVFGDGGVQRLPSRLLPPNRKRNPNDRQTVTGPNPRPGGRTGEALFPRLRPSQSATGRPDDTARNRGPEHDDRTAASKATRPPPGPAPAKGAVRRQA
jgi:hypothetical protein